MPDFLSHILTSTWKESRLLMRDKTGLLVMFMMPAILVVITTLVQENVMEMSGEKQTEILFVDEDQDTVGRELRQALLKTGRVLLVELDQQQDREQALAMVRNGDYQICVIVPAGLSNRLKRQITSLFEASEIPHEDNSLLDELPVYFDPGVLPGFRSHILSILQMAVSGIEMEMKLHAFEKRSKAMLEQIALLMTMQGKPPVDLHLDRLQHTTLTLRERNVRGETLSTPPSAVQHNIPSWSLFGLFFTAIPLAGSLLMERNSGIWRRLLTMPVSPVTLLTGKIIAYIGVCFAQLALIVAIGKFLFPVLGLPAFTLGNDILSLLVITLCSSLAACGYGIFLGSACSTMEQASMFGSISVVVAAAIGGTMVPTHAMPAMMQKISILSPLHWGLEAYQDILLRGHGIMAILPNLALLLLFFSATLLISWWLTRSFR